jgi:hypothetical protein
MRDHSPVKIKNENNISIKISNPKAKKTKSKPKQIPSLDEINDALNNLEYDDRATTYQTHSTHGSGGSIQLPIYHHQDQFNNITAPTIKTDELVKFQPDFTHDQKNDLYDYIKNKVLQDYKVNLNSTSQISQPKPQITQPEPQILEPESEPEVIKPKKSNPIISFQKGHSLGSKNNEKLIFNNPVDIQKLFLENHAEPILANPLIGADAKNKVTQFTSDFIQQDKKKKGRAKKKNN